ncbi:cupin domain-containing protein [Azotobacter chroococcum]|nr:cupin domain-containing protein [Azotobacter chroococcum]
MAGPADYFTGAVVVDMLVTPTEYSQVSGAHVTFAPGARTAWHTHPRGQTLIVTSGKGWVQEGGKDKQEIKPGDVVRIAPGVKHWHGATDTNGMRHIALQEAVDGKNVEWLEQVSDDQYTK